MSLQTRVLQFQDACARRGCVQPEKQAGIGVHDITRWGKRSELGRWLSRRRRNRKYQRKTSARARGEGTAEDCVRRRRASANVQEESGSS